MNHLSRSREIQIDTDGPKLGIFNPQSSVPLADTASKSPRRKSKKKPDRDFPLWFHGASGRWCRTIKKTRHYFGTDKDAALNLWLEQKDDLLAGRIPRVKSDGLVVGDLCERFLNAKRQFIESGELSPRTFSDYYQTCTRLVAQFGKNRRVDDLAADDFEALRADLSKTRGLVGIENAIRLTRIVFKYALDAGLIKEPVRFGPLFKVKRDKIRKAAAGKAPRMFEAADIRKVLAKADEVLKCMILLGMNCAFGQSDLASLPQSAIDLKGGWVTYPRVKTGVERKAALWPETIAAIRKAIALRPDPKELADAGLLFITKYGNRWTRTSEKGGPIDSIALEFGKLLVELKLKRPGLQFYALRHTFRTIADETRDFPAIDRIMGHSDHTMGGRYRERIDDERLKAVTDHVRRWLFPAKKKAR